MGVKPLVSRTRCSIVLDYVGYRTEIVHLQIGVFFETFTGSPSAFPPDAAGAFRELTDGKVVERVMQTFGMINSLTQEETEAHGWIRTVFRHADSTSALAMLCLASSTTTRRVRIASFCTKPWSRRNRTKLRLPMTVHDSSFRTPEAKAALNLATIGTSEIGT